MELIYNVHYEVASLLFLTVVYIFFEVQYAMPTESAHYFRKTSIFMILATFLDVVTAITISYATVIPVWINMLLNTAYFLITAFLLYHYVLYICSFCQSDPSRLNRKLNLIIVLAYIALETVNIFTGITFSFNDTDGYVHGPLFYFTYVVGFYFILDGMYIAVRNRKEIARRQLYSVLFFTFCEVTSLALQMLVFQHTLLSYFGVTVALVVMMFSLETPDYRKLMNTLDELNENRSSLEQMKEAAEHARKEAEDANQAKSAFLASMSHEIRTPINGVLGMNTMILKETDDPVIREYAINIESAGNSLLSIINDILDLSKIESGRMEIIPTEYELSNVLSSCYSLVYMRAQEKGLDLILENNPKIPNRLYGDEVRIRQIIANLLTNAIKYTEEGMVMMTADYEMTGPEDLNLIISVKDTGIGIKKENIEKLFTAFERFDEIKHRSVEGTGLGLKLTKQFLDLMGGTIEVESIEGKGSEFRICLKQKIVGKESLGNFSRRIRERVKPSSEVHESFSAPGCRILVVDDVEINIKVIEGLLKGTLLTIDDALSAEEGLRLIKENHYDLILLDHMMPRMSGIEMFAEMQKPGSGFDPSIPVIMLTANAIMGAREEYLTEGFTDYLSKPVLEPELFEMIMKYLPADKVKTGLKDVSPQTRTAGRKTVSADREELARTIDELSRQEKALYAAALAGKAEAVEARHESFRKIYEDLKA